MDACILTTLNKHVDEMNATIQARTDGEERTYKSADFFGPDAAEEEGVYPVEVLNTLTPSGMAPHQLTLRVGAPVVFLRNLNRDQGMMNGTRGVILALRPWSVQVKLTTGPRSGESFVVPRINLTSSDSGDDHIRFIRRQLPLRLAYCMTINKAQGQTFRPATSLPQGSYRLERGFAPSPHTVVLRCVFFSQLGPKHGLLCLPRGSVAAQPRFQPRAAVRGHQPRWGVQCPACGGGSHLGRGPHGGRGAQLGLA